MGVQAKDVDAVQMPEEFFVIVTTDDPVITWNMSLGTMVSAGAARASIEPDVYQQGLDQWFPFIPSPEFQTFVSWQMRRVIANYRVEYEAERIRCSGFPHLPSRLACLYAWGSLEDVQTARRKMGAPLSRSGLALQARNSTATNHTLQ